MSESTHEPDRVVRSDEEWKERVKAEDRQRDARSQQASGGSAPASQSVPENLPRADFQVLVQMFSVQAMVAMGFIPEPQTGQTVQRLHLARHFIDLLGVLEEKTKGNLTEQEEKLLVSSLHDLRLAFVERSRQPGPAEPPQKTASPE